MYEYTAVLRKCRDILEISSAILNVVIALSKYSWNYDDQDRAPYM